MKFYIHADDGGQSRMASKITFLSDSDGVAATVRVTNEGLTFDDHHGTAGLVFDVAEAGEQIARLLFHYRDYCLVVHPSGTELRGNETRTADVYPPRRQPRINVEGSGLRG